MFFWQGFYGYKPQKEFVIYFFLNQSLSLQCRDTLKNHSINSTISNNFQSALKKKIKIKKWTVQPTSSSTKLGNKAFILAIGNDFFVASGDPKNITK